MGFRGPARAGEVDLRFAPVTPPFEDKQRSGMGRKSHFSLPPKQASFPSHLAKSGGLGEVCLLHLSEATDCDAHCSTGTHGKRLGNPAIGCAALLAQRK